MRSGSKTFYLLVSAAIFGAAKLVFRQSSFDDLQFLLYPTDRIFSLLTGSASTVVPGVGYYYPAQNMVIEKSCSGSNYLLICYLTLTVLAVKHAKKTRHLLLASATTPFIAYFFTVLVNTSRIYASVRLQGGVSLPGVPQNVAHEAIGVAMSVSSLILIYLSAEKLLTSRNKNAQPV